MLDESLLCLHQVTMLQRWSLAEFVDGAARVCDPIVSGHLTGQHTYGQFLKDYAPAPW